MSSFASLEQHAFFLVVLGIVMILFWLSVWGLTEELIEEQVRLRGWTRRQLYMVILAGVFLFFGLYPRILQRV